MAEIRIVSELVYDSSGHPFRALIAQPERECKGVGRGETRSYVRHREDVGIVTNFLHRGASVGKEKRHGKDGAYLERAQKTRQ